MNIRYLQLFLPDKPTYLLLVSHMTTSSFTDWLIVGKVVRYLRRDMVAEQIDLPVSLCYPHFLFVRNSSGFGNQYFPNSVVGQILALNLTISCADLVKNEVHRQIESLIFSWRYQAAFLCKIKQFILKFIILSTTNKILTVQLLSISN